MKSNKGITLTSLLIYIICLTIIIALVATITGYFNKNLSEITVENLSQEQHTRFLSYITKDINNENITYIKTGNFNGYYLVIYFGSNVEHQYICQDGNMYFIKIQNDEVIKKIQLCNNVSSGAEEIFSFNDNILSYNFRIESEEFSGSFNVNFD